ncbi:hypothetical protein BDV98DRAFT_596662 [Pterulicium gracile]|uniref:Glycoside hydrolase superfamily n=1 Tax=Pterulicium gracile TaxID=1884261 RepID=A0A5C3Q8Q3_9AGAR|nr:hypothetical protein BDV98DRAFT_596662 [Pterula gracilis]
MAFISLTTRFLLLASYLAVLTFALDPWTPPLSTSGRYVVDASGNRFKLKSGNWHGASGTYNGEGDRNDAANHHSSENAHDIPLGLQYAFMDRIISEFEAAGINSIRLPFSNELLRMTHKVEDSC